MHSQTQGSGGGFSDSSSNLGQRLKATKDPRIHQAEEQGALSFCTARRGACFQPEGRRWRLGLNLATPQLPELSGLGHGWDIAAAFGWYLMGKIPAKASFLTELKIKGGWGRVRVRLVSALGCL